MEPRLTSTLPFYHRRHYAYLISVNSDMAFSIWYVYAYTKDQWVSERAGERRLLYDDILTKTW